jgi:hypothetical protein
LITSCHVSLYPKTGPETSQTAITATATENVFGLPLICATAFANREYQTTFLMLTLAVLMVVLALNYL